MDRIDYDVALEVASHEAIVRQTYKDSVGINTWSIGLTNKSGHNVDRYIGKPQTLEHCLAVYVWALEDYAERVRRAFHGFSLSKNEFAAALSFEWNTGSILTASWVRLYKQGRVKEAEASFLSWNKAGGKVSQGLVNRRKKEADLLFRGKWSNDGTITEYTRLKANSTPDWNSAKRVNIEAELKRALAGEAKDVLVPDTQPGAVVPAKPSGGNSIASLIAAFFKALFGRS